MRVIHFQLRITVTMGGKTLVDVTDYTYDAATGKISLKKVTGELAITAQGVQKSYAVALMLKDLTSDISQGKKIKHGETLTGKVICSDPTVRASFHDRGDDGW